jgi:hypothetical protein
MNNTLLISEVQLKKGTTINNNIDAEFIRAQIFYCQERFIKPVLGEDLYDEIVNQVSGSSLSSANQIIYNKYLVNALVNYTAGEVLPLIHYRIDNIGVHNRSDSNFQPVDHKEVEYLALQYKNQGAFFCEQLTKYLWDNQTTYPLYMQGNDEAYKMKPSHNATRSSFYLGNRNNCNDPKHMK